MSEEEIRLEVAKLAVKCFVECNGDRKYNNFAVNAEILYNYIKYGQLPNQETDGRILKK